MNDLPSSLFHPDDKVDGLFGASSALFATSDVGSELDTDLDMAAWLDDNRTSETMLDGAPGQLPSVSRSPSRTSSRKRSHSGEYHPLGSSSTVVPPPLSAGDSSIAVPVVLPLPIELSDVPDRTMMNNNANSLSSILQTVSEIESQIEELRQEQAHLSAPIIKKALSSDSAIALIDTATQPNTDLLASPTADQPSIHNVVQQVIQHGISEPSANVVGMIYAVRHSIEYCTSKFNHLYDTSMLLPNEIHQIDRYLTELNIMSQQVDLFVTELIQMVILDLQPSELVKLVISRQPFPCSVKQNKPVTSPTHVRLLTSARVSVRPTTLCKAIVVLPPSKSKKNNITVNNDEVELDSTYVARFTALTFPHGSRLKSIQLKYGVKVFVSPDSNDVSTSNSGRRSAARDTEVQLESELSGDLIVKTNENQWDECEGALLRKSVWGDEPTAKVSWDRFCNVLQLHYTNATRQDLAAPVRLLTLADFFYIRSLKLKPDCTSVSNKDFKRIWEWFGPYMHRIRYQRHMCTLWNSGAVVGFIDRPTAQELLLRTNLVGAFLLRFSERVAGQFAVSYVVASGSASLTVRHYLIRDTDTAGAKKTLPDFLREYKEFSVLLTVTRNDDGERVITLRNKHDALAELYSKKVDSAFDGYEDVIVAE